jgi:hypothetical protein
MLDVRKMTTYISGNNKPEATKIPNYLVEELITKYPDKFYGFYCVNPQLGDIVLDELQDAVTKRGFVGLKLAPLVHHCSLTSDIICKLAELCGDLDIPFYTHVLFSPEASTEKVGYLAKAFPKTKFILGHMGSGPADTDAVEYAKRNDNLFLETSQGSYLIIQQALAALGSSKLIFGSEFPLYHPLPSLANIKVLKCNESDRDNMLYKNILNIIQCS